VNAKRLCMMGSMSRSGRMVPVAAALALAAFGVGRRLSAA
jgi:hypothetical protein